MGVSTPRNEAEKYQVDKRGLVSHTEKMMVKFTAGSVGTVVLGPAKKRHVSLS